MRTSKNRNFRAAPGIPALSLAALLAASLAPQSAFSASNVRIRVDGRTVTLPSTGDTVRAALSDAKVTLGPDDQVLPALDAAIPSDGQVHVSRISFREIAQDEKIPYRVVVRPASRGNRPYHPTVMQAGQNGLKRTTIRVKVVDGREVERTTVGTQVVREAKNQIVVARKPTVLGSRGAYTGARTITVLASAYDPGPGSCGKYANGRTCNGKRAGYGIIAVDPRVFPLGSKLHIPGYGYGIAADVGGAIKGNRVDLGYNSRSGAMKWGKKWVKATIVD